MDGRPAVSWQSERIVWVTIHEPTGRAVVTGPQGGMWERLALEANPRAKWDKDWGGWVLENEGQVADLCILTELNGGIWKETPWEPGLLRRRKEQRAKKAQRGRSR